MRTVPPSHRLTPGGGRKPATRSGARPPPLRVAPRRRHTAASLDRREAFRCPGSLTSTSTSAPRARTFSQRGSARPAGATAARALAGKPRPQDGAGGTSRGWPAAADGREPTVHHRGAGRPVNPQNRPCRWGQPMVRGGQRGSGRAGGAPGHLHGRRRGEGGPTRDVLSPHDHPRHSHFSPEELSVIAAEAKRHDRDWLRTPRTPRVSRMRCGPDSPRLNTASTWMTRPSTVCWLTARSWCRRSWPRWPSWKRRTPESRCPPGLRPRPPWSSRRIGSVAPRPPRWCHDRHGAPTPVWAAWHQPARTGAAVGDALHPDGGEPHGHPECGGMDGSGTRTGDRGTGQTSCSRPRIL